jgi:predicted small secreted protein
MKTLMTLFALLTVAFAAAACHEGPAEKAGRNIDQAADKAGRAIEHAGEKVRDAAK